MFENGTRVEAYIVRHQYTRYDREDLHPEINNSKYIEYQGDIAFGYQIQVKASEKGCTYWWIPKKEAKELIELYKNGEVNHA